MEKSIYYDHVSRKKTAMRISRRVVSLLLAMTIFMQTVGLFEMV